MYFCTYYNLLSPTDPLCVTSTFTSREDLKQHSIKEHEGRQWSMSYRR
jgi:hypothetical protein